MTYEPSDEEIASVMRLAGPERYGYFVERVADWQEIWSLKDGGGWVLLWSGDNTVLFPVWPSRNFADACCENDWEQCVPTVISLDEWLDNWTPGLQRDSRLVAVFPLPRGNAVTVSSEQLASDLRGASEQYE